MINALGANRAARGRVKTEHDAGIGDVLHPCRPRARQQAKFTQLVDRLVGLEADKIGHLDSPAGGGARGHAQP